jgi:tetratricopeptide (TPR) repeat protein
MGFIDGIRSFYYQMKASAFMGKGLKCSRRKEYDKALNYHKLSLRYFALSSNEKLDYCVAEYWTARTLYELGDYAQALEYAESSYNSMKLLTGKSQSLDKTILETKELIDYLRHSTNHS